MKKVAKDLKKGDCILINNNPFRLTHKNFLSNSINQDVGYLFSCTLNGETLFLTINDDEILTVLFNVNEDLTVNLE